MPFNCGGGGTDGSLLPVQANGQLCSAAICRHDTRQRQRELGLRRPCVRVRSADRDGHKFYRSENGVWLTDVVPPAYIRE